MSIPNAISLLGIPSLKQHQTEAINAALSGKDVVVVLPTGYGKSLIYQVLPLVTEKPVLVVMPLIALMEQQVAKLTSLNLCAIHYNNNSQIDISDYQYVFASPESVVESFLKNTKSLESIGSIFVDEAHCIQQWGFSDGKTKAFRTAYACIGETRCFIPQANMIAATATATHATVNGITNNLQLEEPVHVRASINRPNIKFGVKRFPGDLNMTRHFQWLVNYLQDAGQAAKRMIIFCKLLHHLQMIFLYLQAVAPPETCEMFHSKTPPETQERIIRDYSDASSKLKIVVCSSSFSMGVDFPDIAQIIHYGCPADLDEYVQESGRAGRQGQKAYAYIIWHRDAMRGRVSSAMKSYIKTKACRRKLMIDYFQEGSGDLLGGCICSCCDNCESNCGHNQQANISVPSYLDGYGSDEGESTESSDCGWISDPSSE